MGAKGIAHHVPVLLAVGALLNRGTVQPEHLGGVLRCATWPVRSAVTAFRRWRHRVRRRRTGKALHALRHDREYLLGTLEPRVSNQVLRSLDPVSLLNLRQTCRQAHLLVSCFLTRVTLTLPDLIKFSQIPLAAVYPNLEVVYFRLSDSTEAPELAVATQLFLGHSGPHQARTPDISVHTAQGITTATALRAASLSGFFSGCLRLHTIDFSACSAGLDAATLARLLASVDAKAVTGLRLQLPASCLQQAQQAGLGPLRLPGGAALALSQSQQQRRAVPHAEALSAPLRQVLRPLTKGQGSLCLLGPGMLVRCQADLCTLTSLGPSLSQLHLLDAYPYRGSLDWGALEGLVGLQLLAVAPASQPSLSKLLGALPLLPSLSTLLLASPPPSTSASAAAGNTTSWAVELGATEMEILSKLPGLSALEVPCISFPAARHLCPADLCLPHLRHLAAEVLVRVRPLPSLFPSLTSLSIGRCPRLQSLRQPTITAAAGPSIVAVAAVPPAPGLGVAAAPAAAGAALAPPAVGAGAGAAAAGGIWAAGPPAGAAAGAPAAMNGGAAPGLPHIPHLNGSAVGPGQQQQLNVAAIPGAVGAILAAAAGPANVSPAPNFVRLAEVGQLEHLQRLDLTGTSTSQMLCVCAGSNGDLAGLTNLRELHLWQVPGWSDLSRLVLLAQRIVRLHTIGFHGCGSIEKLHPGGHGPADVVQKLGFVKHLVVQGGDARLVQLLSSAKLPNLAHLELLEQQHLLPADVTDLLRTHGRQGTGLKRLEVRGGRHITVACSTMLQQLAARLAAAHHPSPGTPAHNLHLTPACATPAVHVIVDRMFQATPLPL